MYRCYLSSNNLVLQSKQFVKFQLKNYHFQNYPQFNKSSYNVKDSPEYGNEIGIDGIKSKKKDNHFYSNLYPWHSKKELCDHLTNNIIYNEGGIVVLNKPFGVGLNNNYDSKSKTPHHKLMHSRGFGSSIYSLNDILPQLRTTLDMPKLIPIKCAEKFTSGITIFIEDEEKLKERFAEARRKGTCNRILNSSFYIIVTNVPKHNQFATIDEVVGITHPENSHGQAVITRDYSSRSVKKQIVVLVDTKLTVLSKNEEKNVALIKLEVSKTKSNFVRVYCVDLLMPILGDHLYGHRLKFILGEPVILPPGQNIPGIKPQTIPEKVLDSLGIWSENLLEIPTHVHLHQYTLYNYLGKKKPLIVTAPTPPHFKRTLERLGLTEPLLM